MKTEDEILTESTIKEPHRSASNSEDTKKFNEDLKLLPENINSRMKEDANDSNKKPKWKDFRLKSSYWILIGNSFKQITCNRYNTNIAQMLKHKSLRG